MRYRLLATYQGAPFEAGVGPEETGLVLFAACPPPEDLGFEPATGHWRKRVNRSDVQTLYQSRPVGMFRGERCVVLDELTDRLHIAYLGHDAYRAEQLGYWEVDRGVFELITPRQEVTEIVEQRLAVAAADDSASYPQPAPAPPGPWHGYGSERANGSRQHLPPPDPLSGPGRLAPRHQALDDYLQGFPQYQGPAGQSARRSDELGPVAAAGAPVPVENEAPLPLEAEAMRAASAAARKARQDQHAQAASQGPSATAAPAPRPGPQPGSQPGSRPVPSAPAGLSEPSSVLPSMADSAISVPSWSPRPHVLPQRPSAPPPVAPGPVASGPVASGPVAPQPTPPLPAPTDPAALPPVRPAPAGRAGGGTAPAGQVGATALSPEAVRGPAAGGGQTNGTYQGGQASAAGSPPGPGLPRDQFERPLPSPVVSNPVAGGSPVADGRVAGGPAVAATAPAPSAYSAPTTAPPAGRSGPAPASASVGIAVADPVLTAPYPPHVPEIHPAGATAGTPVATAEPGSPAEPAEAATGSAQPASRRRRAARRRLPTQRIFSELAAQAGIPASAYAINDDVDGAMCLVRSSGGFEVFNSLAGARHEVRVFQDEESAYFYLFGVLAADAVRTGVLGPAQ